MDRLLYAWLVDNPDIRAKKAIYKQRLKQIPLEGQSLPCTYLAHHELKVLSLLLLFFNIVIIVILIYQY